MLVILKTHRDVLEHYQQRFKYILVDEYQDTNQSQYLWLRLLAQERKNICCVGDDDQSHLFLARRRGLQHPAVRKGFSRREDHPARAELPLDAAHPRRRLGPDRAEWRPARQGAVDRAGRGREGPGDRRLGRARGGAPGRRGAGDDPAPRRPWPARPARRCAILVRAQFQTREFEDRFIAIGLPYRIVGGFRFYERAEIRDALAYLRVIAQPADDLAFERIVNVPKRGLGDKAVAKLHTLARAEQVPLSVAAARILDTDELTPQARRALGNLVGDFARWRSRLDELSHPELARLVLDESGYTAMLQADRSAESAGRLENLAELARAMEEYETLGAFLEHVSLVMDNDADREADKVTIMTIHAAKGLEFDTVFLAGWEEGVFPSQRALDEGGNASLEEERRLAYVAITRARRKCFIIHAANRRIYGQWTSSHPQPLRHRAARRPYRAETSMTGGESLWRANWSERADPFADIARGTGRGPGWQRAASSGGFDRNAARGVIDVKASAISLGNPGRSDIALGQRVFHSKFGYGVVAEIEGNKLEIDFEQAGRKRVLDSFVSVE